MFGVVKSISLSTPLYAAVTILGILCSSDAGLTFTLLSSTVQEPCLDTFRNFLLGSPLVEGQGSETICKLLSFKFDLIILILKVNRGKVQFKIQGKPNVTVNTLSHSCHSHMSLPVNYVLIFNSCDHTWGTVAIEHRVIAINHSLVTISLILLTLLYR